MKTITISYTTNTIDITKKFAEAAGNYGSKEYKELQQARHDNPGFTINVIANKKKTTKNNFAGLTFKYMESYIEAHDDKNKTIMAEYLELRGKSEEAMEIGAESASIFEIKKWFLNQFPEIKAFYEKREKILTSSAPKNNKSKNTFVAA